MISWQHISESHAIFIRGDAATANIGDHAWLICELLSQSSDSLLRYVIGACLPKMLYRFNHAISTHYFKILDQISKSGLKFQNVTIEDTKPKQRMVDIQFFHNILPAIATKLQKSFPKLQQAVGKLAPQLNDISEIYNKDTYEEFHLLLCDLISYFHDSMKNLDDLKKKDPFTRLSHLSDAVGEVAFYGAAVQTLAGGVIIKMHFEVITSHLTPAPAPAPGQPKAMGTGTATAMEQDWELDDDEQNGELDHDSDEQNLNGELDDDELRKIKSLKDWLMVMVVHFNAVRILAQHLREITTGTGTSPQITIKVLLSPHPNNQLLGWKELLENTRYINEFATGTHTAEIIKFLKEWTPTDGPSSNIEELMKNVRNLQMHWQGGVIAEELIDDIMKQMVALKKWKSPGWRDLIVKLGTLAEKLKSRNTLAKANAIIDDIIRKLRALRDRAALFNKLVSISSGKGFKGSEHCELHPALLSRMKPEDLPEEYRYIMYFFTVSCCFYTVLLCLYFTMKGIGPVIGISKYSCPACTMVFEHLAKVPENTPVIFEALTV
jgi:hypothetical protein